jgi:hypothetical protein
MSMALKQRSIAVLMSDPADPGAEPVEHVVALILADQLRAEGLVKQRGMNSDYPMAHGAAAAWSAMARQKLTTLTLEQFNLACLNMGNPDAEPEDGTPVDPTDQAASPDSA